MPLLHSCFTPNIFSGVRITRCGRRRPSVARVRWGALSRVSVSAGTSPPTARASTFGMGTMGKCRGWHGSPVGWHTACVYGEPDTQRRRWPTSLGGVYAFFCDGRLAYIGSTVNLAMRLAEHEKRMGLTDAAPVATKWGTFSRVEVRVSISRFYGDWATKELRLIRRLRPAGNIVNTNRSRGRAAFYFRRRAK